jgi:hypothetical protein
MAVKKAENKAARRQRAKERLPVCRLAAGVLFALAAGGLAGWGRYWYGYFVLGQGTIAGLFIPWAAAAVCSRFNRSPKTVKNPGPIALVLILFLCFMTAQGIAFGMAQPWFDPVGWLGRVIQHATKETVWGISLLGGVAAQNFQMGINGGFWIFLNLFDLFFMSFFLLVGINSHQEGKK